MKRTLRYMFTFILLFVTIPKVYATNIVNYDADGICEAVKTNKTIRVGVYGYYDKKIHYMESPTSDCNNLSVFNKKKESIKKGETYVRFSRAAAANTIYIDDVLVKNKKAQGKYSYFYISNRNKVDPPNSTKTLNPGEKIFVYLNINDKKIKSNTHKDLRISMDVGIMNGTDTEIQGYNTMAIYVYTDKKTYGPFSIVDYKYLNVLTEKTSEGKSYNITTYRMTSSNLVANIPSGETIKAIRVYPYYHYTVNKGSFRLFNISVDGYSKYDNGKKYVTVESASNIIRHNVVNNMLENATVKWNLGGTTKLHFYHHYSSSPNLLNPSKTNLYGIPYVNSVNTTISQFTHHGKVNNVSDAKKNDTSYFTYELSSVYLTDTTTRKGKTIKAGDKIKNNVLYAYETNKDKDDDLTITRGQELNNASLDFVLNNPGYMLGLDCSSSTYLAAGREIPTISSLAYSNKYYSNGFVQIVNNKMKITADKVEKYLREKGILKKDQIMTVDLYKQYYDNYLKDTYDKTEFYENYGLLIPGDFLVSQGHVRMVTGYSHVQCNNKKDGKVLTTNKYKKGFCDDYGGINAKKSYVIITEVGGFPTKKYNSTKERVTANKTGWKYTLNPKLTDLTSVDDLYDTSKKRLSSFHINVIYYFSDLIKTNKLYVGFRYKEISNHLAKKEVEKPVAKFVLDKEYDNKNQELYNYLAKTKTLKGRIFTNYLIDTVRFEINGTKYYIYPYQTTNFSLYNITDTKVLNALKKIDFNKSNNIKISVKFGPNIDSVKTAAGADKDGYIKVIDTTNMTQYKPVYTTGIKIDKTSAKVNVGKTVTLKATVTPDNADDKTVIWSSSDKKIATVDSNGKVKGISNGTVTITAKTNDTGKKATAKITVKTPVTGVKLSKSKTTINKGRYETVKATVLPETASDQSVSWSSSDNTVAKVDENGKITAVKNGTATITVTTTDGGKTASVEVTVVTPTVAVTGVTLNKTAISIDIGQTEKVTATVKPSNATNKGVVFTSDDSSVATVDNDGLITGIGVGTTNVKVTTNDGGKTATVAVEVKPIKVKSISLNISEVSLEMGETYSFIATITPTTATNKKVIWSSASTKVATVDQNGKVTTKGEGMTTITAKTEDGGKTATAKVYVSKKEPIDEGKEDEEDDDEEEETVVEPPKPTTPTTPTDPSKPTTPTTPTTPTDPSKPTDPTPTDPEDPVEAEEPTEEEVEEETTKKKEKKKKKEQSKTAKYITIAVVAFGSTAIIGGVVAFIKFKQ